MAVLTIISQPPLFSSAYKPMTVGVTSMRSPVNMMPGESGIGIIQIKLADAADVASFGAPLEVGDLFVNHAVTTLGIWPIGQTIIIAGCDIPEYDGVWRVLKLVTDKITVIACADLGVATVGTISKHYENYRLDTQVTMQGTLVSMHYDLEPNSAGVFELNAQDFAQRSFQDVFAIAGSGQPFALIDAEKYITQEWSVIFEEAYNIPDNAGINVYTELGKDGENALLNDQVVVNSVQPYHHIDEETGEPDILWEDDLFLHELIEGPIAQKHWLTYHPPGGLNGYLVGNYREKTAQRAGEDDDLWLAFLWAQNEYVDRLFLRVISYGADGLQDDLQDIALILEKDSYIFNAGPVALAAYLAPTTDHYRVSIVNNIGTDLMVPMWVTLDRHCNAPVRFYFFNSFGAIDQYTVEGSNEGRNTEVKRATVEKPNMVRNLTVAGDYQRRTWATENLRKYTATTRTENKAVIRWLCDEMIESPDVRILKYNGDVWAYTYVVMETDKAGMGVRGARLNLEWSLGVDNRKQRR